jgi:hypothetical protein
LLGPWSNSLWVVAVLWGSIGALLGLVSILVVPYRSNRPEVAR